MNAANLITKWNQHRDTIILIAYPTIAVITLAIALFVAYRIRKSYRAAKDSKNEATWISNYVMATILIISADGMWRILYMHMHIPAIVAVPVCFVSEGIIVALMALAKHRNADPAYGTPGPYAAGVWITAEAFGIVVALNSTSALEFLLRLLLPNSVAMLWHLQLIAKNAKKPDAITWRWTPRNLAAWAGIIEPGDRTLADRRSDRQAAKIARLRLTLEHHAETGDKRDQMERRLQRLTLTADDEVVAKAEAALRRAYTITDRTARDRLRTPLAQLELCATPTTPPAAPTEPSTALDIKTPTIPPVTKTNGHTPELRVPVVAASITRPAASGSAVEARRAADLRLVDQHRDALTALYRDDNLTRTTVENVCGVNRRQADRIKAYVEVLIANTEE